MTLIFTDVHGLHFNEGTSKEDLSKVWRKMCHYVYKLYKTCSGGKNRPNGSTFKKDNKIVNLLWLLLCSNKWQKNHLKGGNIKKWPSLHVLYAGCLFLNIWQPLEDILLPVLNFIWKIKRLWIYFILFNINQVLNIQYIWAILNITSYQLLWHYHYHHHFISYLTQEFLC